MKELADEIADINAIKQKLEKRVWKISRKDKATISEALAKIDRLENSIHVILQSARECIDSLSKAEELLLKAHKFDEDTQRNSIGWMRDISSIHTNYHNRLIRLMGNRK